MYTSSRRAERGNIADIEIKLEPIPELEGIQDIPAR